MRRSAPLEARLTAGLATALILAGCHAHASHKPPVDVATPQPVIPAPPPTVKIKPQPATPAPERTGNAHEPAAPAHPDSPTPSPAPGSAQ